MKKDKHAFGGNDGGEFTELDTMEELSDDIMATLFGGTGLSSNRSDLYHYSDNFVQKRVQGVKRLGRDSVLLLRKRPGGDVLYGYGWQNNEYILVNRYKDTWSGIGAFCDSEKGGGAFGYVDSTYFS